MHTDLRKKTISVYLKFYFDILTEIKKIQFFQQVLFCTHVNTQKKDIILLFYYI